MGQGTIRFVTLHAIQTLLTTNTCSETFKIESGILNCNSQKVAYLLKCRMCGEAPYVGKPKNNFRARFDNY